MSSNNPKKFMKRSASFYKFEVNEESLKGLFKGDGNTKNSQIRHLSRLKIDNDGSSDSNNKDNITSKLRKSNQKFTYRGRMFLPFKKESDKGIIQKPSLILANDCAATQKSQENILSLNKEGDKQLNKWKFETNLQNNQENNNEQEQIEENIVMPTKKEQKIVEDEQNYEFNNNIEKMNEVYNEVNLEKQVNSLESIDNGTSLTFTNRIKSPSSLLPPAELRSNSTNNHKINSNNNIINSNISFNKHKHLIVSPKTISQQALQTTGLKNKKLRPTKIGRKSITKQSTLLLEEKLSDMEMEDYQALQNKPIIQKSLTSNQLQLLLPTNEDNRQIEIEEQIIGNNKSYQQNDDQIIVQPQENSNITNANQQIDDVLLVLEQQKTDQTINEETDLPMQNQSELFPLDYENEEQQLQLTSSINSNKFSHLLSKEKGLYHSKDKLQDLEEVIEDDTSTQNKLDQDHFHHNHVTNNSIITNKNINNNNNNNIDLAIESPNLFQNNQICEKEKQGGDQLNQEDDDDIEQIIISVSNSPVKKSKEKNQCDQITPQQYFESVRKQDLIQYSPAQFNLNNDIKQQFNNTGFHLQLEDKKNSKPDSQNDLQINYQPQIIHSDQVQTQNCMSQNEFACVGEQQDVITETDKNQSPTDKFLSSQLNSANQDIQKATIQLGNLNNDSNLYGSESTNEPNSVKKSNLTSSLLSYNFGKCAKTVQDQKTQISSQESNNNSQETVKLQSISKNIMEYGQFSIKRFPNEEEDEEKPEIIQYSKPFFPTNLNYPNDFSHQNEEGQQNIDFINSQTNQKSDFLPRDNQQISFATSQYKSAQKLSSDQMEFNSYDKFKSSTKKDNISQDQDSQKNNNNNKNINNTIPNNNNDNDKTIETTMLKKKKSHRKMNSNLRFQQYNSRSSPTYFEQSQYFVDETIKSNTGQKMLNQQHNQFVLNDEDDMDKQQGQIPHVPSLHQKETDFYNKNNLNINDKENNRLYENKQEGQGYYISNQILKSQMNSNDNNPQQQIFTHPSNNNLFTDQNNKIIGKQNDNQQQQQDKLRISSIQVQKNGNQITLGDHSPSHSENISDYMIYWNEFKLDQDKNKKFTCKEICYLLWPQKLDRKQRQDKELIINLFEQDYDKENQLHKSLLESVSLHYYRFLNGNIYNHSIVEDKELTRRFLRQSTHAKPYKSYEENKRVQSIQELYNDPKSSFEQKIFSLILILAFLINYRDIQDQIWRKAYRKIQLIYLLIRISNVVLQKFKGNVFDKCIQLSNKDVLDFLNDIFYSIFCESIQSIFPLDNEIHQMNVKLYAKVDTINKQLINTNDIMLFILKNTPQLQKTIQTIQNIIH